MSDEYKAWVEAISEANNTVTQAQTSLDVAISSRMSPEAVNIMRQNLKLAIQTYDELILAYRRWLASSGSKGSNTREHGK